MSKRSEAKAEAKQREDHERRVDALAVEANRAFEAYDIATLKTGVTSVPGVQLKKGEVAYAVLDPVGLVEPRREPGKWVGGSQGVSFRVMKGVRYHVGQSRGTYTQGAERPTVIDTGRAVVTNQRMLFVGSSRSTEWAYAKLLGYSLEEDAAEIFNVSNRQKASGFAYPPEVDHKVDAVVMAAVAAFQGADEHAAVVDDFLTAYRESHAAWTAANGVAPAALATDAGPTASASGG